MPGLGPRTGHPEPFCGCGEDSAGARGQENVVGLSEMSRSAVGDYECRGAERKTRDMRGSRPAVNRGRGEYLPDGVSAPHRMGGLDPQETVARTERFERHPDGEMVVPGRALDGEELERTFTAEVKNRAEADAEARIVRPSLWKLAGHNGVLDGDEVLPENERDWGYELSFQMRLKLKHSWRAGA